MASKLPGHVTDHFTEITVTDNDYVLAYTANIRRTIVQIHDATAGNFGK